jgi:hypothetical protein
LVHQSETVGRIGGIAFSFLYLAVRALLGALVRSRRGLDVKDVELLMLRHELEILRRRLRGRSSGWLTGHCWPRPLIFV